MGFSQRFKPGVTKMVLLLFAAAIWGFAAFKILWMADKFLDDPSISIWRAVIAGIAGFYFLFKYVFLKVCRRYIKRILELKPDRPCLFAFFDVKVYLIMGFMITIGIVAGKVTMIPRPLLGIFYISLGLSMFVSAVMFVYSGFTHKINLRLKDGAIDSSLHKDNK